MVAQPLGHTYKVGAMFNDYEGMPSEAATLVSHNPYFDSSGVSCTATSCEDDAVRTVCPLYAGDGSCMVSVTSILLDPEVDALDNVYCQYGLTCGDVTVGLSNQDYEGSCWPSFSHSLGGASYSTSHEGEEPCGGWPSCSGDFYCSITKDLLNATGPTYLTMVVHSCQSCELNSATFYVKGIKPEWIDVGIETEGGGMSEDSCGNWVDTSGSCTCTTSCDDVAYVAGRDGDMDGDGIPDYADGYNLMGCGTDDDYSTSGATDPGLTPVAIGGVNLPQGAVIHVDYDASAPLDVTWTGTGTTEDPYVFTLPESGSQRLWITDSSHRNGNTVEDGGDYLAPGDYTVSQATGTCDTSLWVTVGSYSVDLKHLYLEDVGSPSSTENASQSESMSYSEEWDISVAASNGSTSISASSVATGVTAWDTDPAAKYDQQTVAKLRPLIANEITKMIDNGEKADCADVAYTSLIRAASQLRLRVRLRYYSNGWKYFDSSSGLYKSVEEFEKAVRQNMGTITLWDNTKQIAALSSVRVGDIILYDLRDHGMATYKGHAMPVLEVAKDSSGKATQVAVAEGHTSQTPGVGTLIGKGTYSLEQIMQKGGWGGPGRKEKQPNGYWILVEPGPRVWDWSRIGGGG
jgi:hypothetical protein